MCETCMRKFSRLKGVSLELFFKFLLLNSWSYGKHAKNSHKQTIDLYLYSTYLLKLIVLYMKKNAKTSSIHRSFKLVMTFTLNNTKAHELSMIKKNKKKQSNRKECTANALVTVNVAVYFTQMKTNITANTVFHFFFLSNSMINAYCVQKIASRLNNLSLSNKWTCLHSVMLSYSYNNNCIIVQYDWENLLQAAAVKRHKNQIKWNDMYSSNLNINVFSSLCLSLLSDGAVLICTGDNKVLIEMNCITSIKEQICHTILSIVLKTR